jgi:hypothetical protein
MARMRSASTQLSLLAIWLQTSLVGGAPGASSSPSVQLYVRSVSNCVSEATLIAGVQARTPRVRFVESQGDRQMQVSFERSPTGLIYGELAMVEGSKSTLLRQVSAASCKDAADAMALILAITLDPDGVETVVEPSPVESEPGPNVTAPPQASETAPQAASQTGDTSEPVAQLPPTTRLEGRQPESVYIAPMDEAPPRQVAGQPWSFSGLVGGELLFGSAPSLMRGVSVDLLFATQRSTFWSPAVMVGGVAAWSPVSVQSEGDAAFSLQALTVDLCPWRFGGAELELRTCGELLGGRFGATASNTRNSAGTVDRPFVSVGGLGSVHIRPSQHFEIAVRIAALANLVRDEFTFAPRVFHTVAPLTVSFGMLVGFHLPD